MRAAPFGLWALAACGGEIVEDPLGVDPGVSDDGGGDEGSTGDGDSGDTDEPDDTGEGDDTGEPVVPGPFGPAVVLFIGDGMGSEHVRGGSLFATGAEGGLAMEAAPFQGWIQTASLTGYTDSAASATAYATGLKTWNGVLGMDDQVEPVVNVFEEARDAGMSLGVITTDELTGATPAAFMVHEPSRYDKEAIALAMMEEGLPDVLMGGGASTLRPHFEEAGIIPVNNAEELAAADPDALPLYGLFSDFAFPWVSDGYEAEPSLAVMVEAALDRLEDDEEGFILMVEGARIDHASHFNIGDSVHHETVAFDEAIAVAVDRLEGWGDRPHLVVVTADHECGGLSVGESEGAGTVPETTWRWYDHTNVDVPVYAWGEGAEVLHGARSDNTVVHAVLRSVALGVDFEAPTEIRLPDGELDDLGDAVVIQTHETDFGEGYTQLDALRLTADERGLWVGVDGVFDDEANSVIVWVDLDYGAGTGVGADLVLDDTDGPLDAVLTTLLPSVDLPGLGFDAAAAQAQGTYVRHGTLYDDSGLRVFHPPEGEVDDVWWMNSTINFDSGNLALGGPAVDAAETGLTEHGMELRLPWDELISESSLDPEGFEVAVFVQVVNDDLTTVSNQALPPYDDPEAVSPESVPVTSVAVLAVDGDGNALGEAILAP